MPEERTGRRGSGEAVMRRHPGATVGPPTWRQTDRRASGCYERKAPDGDPIVVVVVLLVVVVVVGASVVVVVVVGSWVVLVVDEVEVVVVVVVSGFTSLGTHSSERSSSR